MDTHLRKEYKLSIQHHVQGGGFVKQELLKLRPTRYLCPYCGEWHVWKYDDNLESCNSYHHPAILRCQYPNVYYGKVEIYFSDKRLYYSTSSICRRANQRIEGNIPIFSIIENPNRPIVTFDVKFESDNCVNRNECCNCDFKSECNFLKLGDEGDNRHMMITFGFEFEPSEYEQFSTLGKLALEKRELKAREDALKHREEAVQEREQVALEEQANKEEKAMGKEKMSLRRMLYEKSPKENLERVVELKEKYKPTLQWAIPVVAVYGAYKILNSKSFDLSVNNVAEVCQERLGLRLAFLEDKKALKELMAIGGIASGVYGTIRLASTLFGPKEEKDITVEDVESGLNKVEELHKKFPYIQPKFENLLPVALSVLLVYVSLHKPKFEGKMAQKVKDLTEDFRVKIETYLELFKLFVEDKFKMDLSSEEEQRKVKLVFAITAMLGIGIFLYGKKILVKTNEEDTDKEAENEKMNEFVKQARAIVEKIAPTLYTTLITFLVSKKILELGEKGEVENIKDVGFIPVDDEAEDSDNAEGAGISDEEGTPTENK